MLPKFLRWASVFHNYLTALWTHSFTNNLYEKINSNVIIAYNNFNDLSCHTVHEF